MTGRYFRRRRLGAPPRDNTLTLLNLSLFIMLLSFFIVLNGVSTFEESKYHPILQNLRETFSISLLREDDAPSQTPSALEAIREGQATERIEALFNAQVAGVKGMQAPGRGRMHMEMPLDAFDRAVTAAGQIDLSRQGARATGLQTYLVPTLVSLMTGAADGSLGRTRLELILQVRDNPPLLANSDPAVLADATRTAAAYAALLQDAGLPPELLSIGVRRGDPRTVSLYFHPHKPYEPAKAVAP